MSDSESLLELIAAAQANAKTLEDRISNASGEPELHDATTSLELTAVDIFSVFEARMQHHFKRGPFSRKLKTLLLASDQPDLADRLHQYYLAVNVLKHGKGASHRELLASPSTLIVVRTSPAADEAVAETSVSLIDVTVSGFFDGLSATLIEAYQFLENR